MKQKKDFPGLLSSYSETARKFFAGVCMACAATALFFAWSAKITARFPVLGPDIGVARESADISQTVPPSGALTKGLTESIKDAVGVLKDSVFSARPPGEPGASSASSSESLHELFNKVSDDERADGEATTSAPQEDSFMPPGAPWDHGVSVQKKGEPNEFDRIEDLPQP